MTFQSADAAPATGERNKVDEGANADRALKAAEPHQSQDGAAAGAGVNWPANAAALPKRPASARGLFRATGKTSKPVAVRDLSGEIVKADALEREKDDFYPTPPEPTRALLAVEGDRLRDFPCIWEPACGDGAMVREMEAVGLRVQKTDLIDRGCGAMIADFYSFSAGPRAIVTNPPFAECNKDPGWVRHAMERIGVEYMALLLPVNWLGAQGRAGLWSAYPASRVYLMRWRIDFTGQGAPPMLNAWFVWDNARQSSLFAGAA